MVELAGAIGLLIPRLSGLAALGMAGVMFVAALIHLTILPPRAVAMAPGVLCLLFLMIAWGRRSQTARLFGRNPA